MPLRRWDLAFCQIWRSAYMKGELVYAMSQRRTDPIQTPGPWGKVHGGYCLGLATEWLAFRGNGGDFDYNQRKRVFDAPVWKATMYQNIQSQQPGVPVPTLLGDNLSQKIVAPIRAANMVVTDVTDQNRVDAPSIRLATTRLRGYRYLVALFSNTGGHAVAIHHDDQGRVHFFDPNYGHFNYRSPDRFEKWLRYFLKRTHYGAHYTRSQIVCVQ